MADIGLGYGSEYQLMRFLGHHRNYLNRQIQKVMNTQESICWFDYPMDEGNLSFDGEYKGTGFLNDHKDYETIKKEWEKFWSKTGNAPNWDAVCKIGKEYVLVEAKAHLNEMKSSCGAKEKSIQSITKAFEGTREFYGVKNHSDWMKTYYQLANRLAFIYFLNALCSIKIEASLLNIYFLNGYKKRVRKAKNGFCILADKSVTDIKTWDEAIKEEYKYLGLTKEEADYRIHSVFIDCLSKQDIV